MINLLANDHVANLSIFDYKHHLIDVIRLTDGMRAGKMRDQTISTLTLNETSASCTQTCDNNKLVAFYGPEIIKRIVHKIRVRASGEMQFRII